jgi:hypothetical protein
MGPCVRGAGDPGAPYVHWLTDKYMGPHVSPEATAPSLHIFISDVASMNVASYIRQCHVTDEYNLKSSIPMNTLGYVHQRYARRCIRRLTDKFKLYSSV